MRNLIEGKKRLAFAAVLLLCFSLFASLALAEETGPVQIKNVALNMEAIASRKWLPEYDQLTAAALNMRNNFSYAPYSHYHVGAALLGADDKIYTGCNVENAAYPVGICAEQTAFVKAVSEGCRKFKALVVAGSASDRKGSDFCAPCGMCRQAIREFCDPDFPIILVEADENGAVKSYKIYKLDELLVDSFGPNHLK